MQVGDLVEFKNNGMLGLVVKEKLACDGDKIYTIAWTDGHTGPRWADELEVVSESR